MGAPAPAAVPHIRAAKRSGGGLDAGPARKDAEEPQAVVRVTDTKTSRLPPHTPQEREQALAALDRIRRRRARMLAARAGKFFPSATEVIRELREESEQDLA